MSLEHSPARAGKETSNLPSLPDDYEVLTFEEWRTLNKIKERTARRILAGPISRRPVITQLSKQRIGITKRANRIWQAACAR